MMQAILTQRLSLNEEPLMKPIQITPQEMASVQFKYGADYQHTDTQECVTLIGVSSTTLENVYTSTLHLLSCDRMVDGEYLSYMVTEEYFKKHLVPISLTLAYERNLSLSF